MSNMSGAGLPQLVQEIKLASENIRKSDEANREKLEAIEASINDLYGKNAAPRRRVGGAGAPFPLKVANFDAAVLS
jgi:hypothetical protein